jgi:hypothetical protein
MVLENVMLCRQCPRARARFKRVPNGEVAPWNASRRCQTKLPVNGIACDERTDGSGDKDDITARVRCCRKNFPI